MADAASTPALAHANAGDGCMPTLRCRRVNTHVPSRPPPVASLAEKKAFKRKK